MDYHRSPSFTGVMIAGLIVGQIVFVTIIVVAMVLLIIDEKQRRQNFRKLFAAL